MFSIPPGFGGPRGFSFRGSFADDSGNLFFVKRLGTCVRPMTRG